MNIKNDLNLRHVDIHSELTKQIKKGHAQPIMEETKSIKLGTNDDLNL